MRHLSIDIETYSSVDIKKAGLYRYAQSPDFQILLFAYSYDGGPVQLVDLAQGEMLPDQLLHDLQDPNVIKHAYNAAFEWYCINQYLNPYNWITPLPQWRCTMLHGLYCGYPAGLGMINTALGLPQDKRKMGVGTSLIRLFCCPTEPTAKNGQRTRTLPHHEPEKWGLFKEYCRQDVVAEMEVERRLSAFPVPAQEQRLWELDLQMNATGAAIDLDLVRGALAVDEVSAAELMAEAKKLTGLDNPKSVAQLSVWLQEETGEEVENLRKGTVADMLAGMDEGKAQRMLEIRLELAKASVKKYDAMMNAVCDDGRVRGLLQFYGANRTGRWAGRLVQIQNLPRNHMDTLDLARDLVKKRNADAIKLIYGNVPDTLSQLIRTAFVPKPGHVFHVADFSAIEARVIAWLAGELWRLDVFATHGKIYEASASQMFGVPIERIKKGNPEYELRQKGKVAELACIAEGELVLTDQGLVPIEDVTTDMRVWDGVEWALHEGVIYKGEREVIQYGGLTATPDHTVFAYIDGKPRPIQFSVASSCCYRLVEAGAGGACIRKRGDNQPRETMERRLARSLRADTLHWLRGRAVDELQQPIAWQDAGLPNLLAAEANTEMAGQAFNRSKAALHQSKRQRLSELRRKGDKIPIRVRAGCWPVDARELRDTKPRNGVGSDRQQWTLRAGKPALGYAYEEQPQQALHGAGGMEAGGLALCTVSSDPEAVKRLDAHGSDRGSLGSGTQSEKELARHTQKVKVFDLVNAGPLHRFTVSGVLVHNCGYQGGVGALKAMGADQMGLDDDHLGEIIRRWRGANKRICDLWYSYENAAFEALRTGKPVGAGKMVFAYEGDASLRFLTITLPSGRKLYYAEPRLMVNEKGREAIHHMGNDQKTKKWSLLSTYGGKLTENITQAVARDCLAETLLRVQAAGYQTVFHVHDEVIVESPEGTQLQPLLDIMATPITWAPGLLLKGAGFTCGYYQKD